MIRKSNENMFLPVDKEFHKYFKVQASKRGLTMKKFGQILQESNYLDKFEKLKEDSVNVRFKIGF